MAGLQGRGHGRAPVLHGWPPSERARVGRSPSQNTASPRARSTSNAPDGKSLWDKGAPAAPPAAAEKRPTAVKSGTSSASAPLPAATCLGAASAKQLASPVGPGRRGRVDTGDLALDAASGFGQEAASAKKSPRPGGQAPPLAAAAARVTAAGSKAAAAPPPRSLNEVARKSLVLQFSFFLYRSCALPVKLF